MRRHRFAIASAATMLVLGPLAWFWQVSLLPDAYALTDIGQVDGGGAHHAHPAAGRSVATLTADQARPADVAVTLTARQQRFQLASGREVDGYTLNGQSPGPTIRAAAGQVLEVRLVNESVRDGVTLHWHGVDLPNAMDGVAGVTQDAVGIGEDFTYRFVAQQFGTFWYHSHQLSHEQVRGGLLGALVLAPPQPAEEVTDVVALTHVYDGVRTINGAEGDVQVAAPPGGWARVRVINTDNGPTSAWVAGARSSDARGGGSTWPFRLVAVDGTELNQPTPVDNADVLVTAGGRVDLEVMMPADGSPIRVHVGGRTGIVLGSRSYQVPAAQQPAATVDLLRYGAASPPGFDPNRPDRRFRYDIGRRPGFINGRPGLFWTVNGHLYPDVPMFVVSEGDVVRVSISNHSGEVHPMHLHGHHALVLNRNGAPASGSPWWVDSLNVADGESYDIAFVANNPGIWTDHCHNLTHASDGLVAHVMYDGITTPYLVGGPAGNRPE